MDTIPHQLEDQNTATKVGGYLQNQLVQESAHG